MAVIRKNPSKNQNLSQLRKTLTNIWNLLQPSNLWDFSLNPDRCCGWLAAILMTFEVVVNVAVIWKVNYTEIDWIAYMQEVEGVVNGTRDYSQLKGDTGPLVYPAGFVWFYMALYYLTEYGKNVRLAQYFFAVIYLVILGLVFRLLLRTKKVPNVVLVMMSCTSYRIHSICVLRLFNDPVAMMFLYAAINAFADDRWSLGSFFYTIAVSIKMNILLFSPALLLAYLATQGIYGTIWQLFICGSFQLVVAAPFLTSHPISYLRGAFDLGRVFLFKWTVNWRFLPEDIFVHRGLHVSLLLLHIVILMFMAKTCWWRSLQEYNRSRNINHLLLPLFTCNFIGIACARSLHYQFYVWYYHQLHYLCWSGLSNWTSNGDILRLLILGIVEMCWNTYPSTEWSSALLHLCHIMIFVGVVTSSSRSTSSMRKNV